MSASKIEWTNKTWNPVVGCNKVSQGCKNCYAEVMHKRLMVLAPHKYSRPFLDGAFPYEPDLGLPLTWKKPCMIFVNSMSDLFHENVPFSFIDKVFVIMKQCPQHTFQILTKRPDRMLTYFNRVNFHSKLDDAVLKMMREMDGLRSQPCYVQTNGIEGFPLPNVWLGTSVEDQTTAEQRIQYLVKVPAAVRWLSCEPLLGPIDLNMAPWAGPNSKEDWRDAKAVLESIHWVVAGGESGPGARPMHPNWPRQLRDQCQAAGVPFFFKQWGVYGDMCHGNPLKTKAVCVGEDGKFIHYPAMGNEVDLLKTGKTMFKNGKEKSGRKLDGQEWNGYPKKNDEVTKVLSD